MGELVDVFVDFDYGCAGEEEEEGEEVLFFRLHMQLVIQVGEWVRERGVSR